MSRSLSAVLESRNPIALGMASEHTLDDRNAVAYKLLYQQFDGPSVPTDTGSGNFAGLIQMKINNGNFHLTLKILFEHFYFPNKN